MKTNDTLAQDLEYLKLTHIQQNFHDTANLAASKNWDHIGFLEALIHAEAQEKRKRAMQRRLNQARFPLIKSLSDYNFTWPKKINRTQIQHLHRLEFIPKAANVMLLGTVGLGKTHLAISLGVKACEAGYRVRFTTAIGMINALSAAQKRNALKDELKRYICPQLLVLDELGYLPIDHHGADLLFQVVSGRYEQGSIILTSNKAYRDWPSIFNNDSTITSAVLDRLLHHSDTVLIEGKSYRMKERIDPDHADHPDNPDK